MKTTTEQNNGRERKRPPVHPGRIIRKHYLEPLNLSITEVAAGLKVSRKTLSAIVNERAPVTVSMALKLAKAFDTSPLLWIRMQNNYDLWHEARGNKEINQVRTFVNHSGTAACACG